MPNSRRHAVGAENLAPLLRLMHVGQEIFK
jgi:hypothetical protein